MPPMTRAEWSADIFSDSVKVAFYADDGHPISLILSDPAGREVGRVPIAGSGVWGPESCVVQVEANGHHAMIGEITMTAAAFHQFETTWSRYVLRAWGSPNADVDPGSVIALSDSGCRARL